MKPERRPMDRSPVSICVLVVWVSLACACVSAPATNDSIAAAGESSACRRYLESLDRMASVHRVIDAQAARVKGYPFLRTDRFLASFPPGTLNPDAFGEWLGRLQMLDLEGRRIEIANLPRGPREDLAIRFDTAGHDPRALIDRAEHCGQLLRRALVDSPDLRADLATRVTVPDDYRGWQRVIGLYPLLQIPFAIGVRGWQANTERDFAKPEDALPRAGELLRYLPPPAPAPSAIGAADSEHWRNDPLGISEPPPGELASLLLAHAPVLMIDTASDQDRMGAIELGPAGRSRVATATPVVYAYVSQARWHGAIVLQLNYVLWFPSRPSDGVFDLLAGHLDGITWRLTLGPDGRVLVADTIHNCGCYHLFFPSAALRPVAYGAAAEERPFAPQQLPELDPGERFTLRIASRTHYLQRVSATPLGAEAESDRRYELRPYNVLRSLDAGVQGRASLFGRDGVVPGTERAERFVFWPMGVPDPGAMRQRGRHATAFVGRRHFDDPWLLERSFVPVDP
jgi:hypothetical protein